MSVTTAATTSGTDLHIFSGEANYNTDERGQPIPLPRRPQILGHEIAGVVEATGSEVGDLHEGETKIGQRRLPEERSLGQRHGSRMRSSEVVPVPDDTLIDKIRTLPPEKVAEGEDFVDFLKMRDEDRLVTRAATKLSIEGDQD